MTISEVRIQLAPPGPRPLLAYCSLVIDGVLCVRDVKVIGRRDGEPFVAMPSRVVADHCPKCSGRTPLTASFCPSCGERLPAGRVPPNGRPHADVVFPVSAAGRALIEAEVLAAYRAEVGKGIVEVRP